MKKIFLLIALVLTSGFYLGAIAQADDAKAQKIKQLNAKKGEKIFIAQADKTLAIIEEAAHKLQITGTAVIAFIPGEKTEAWISKMKVVGFFTDAKSNTLGIAYTKASEMADTFTDSGSRIRKPLTGEYGWKGGTIRKVPGGYILATFSGASGEDDFAVATEGLNYLYQAYSK